MTLDEFGDRRRDLDAMGIILCHSAVFPASADRYFLHVSMQNFSRVAALALFQEME